MDDVGGDEGVQVDAVRKRHEVHHRDDETRWDAGAQAGGRVQRGEGHEGGVGAPCISCRQPGDGRWARYRVRAAVVEVVDGGVGRGGGRKVGGRGGGVVGLETCLKITQQGGPGDSGGKGCWVTGGSVGVRASGIVGPHTAEATEGRGEAAEVVEDPLLCSLTRCSSARREKEASKQHTIVLEQFARTQRRPSRAQRSAGAPSQALRDDRMLHLERDAAPMWVSSCLPSTHVGRTGKARRTAIRSCATLACSLGIKEAPPQLEICSRRCE